MCGIAGVMALLATKAPADPAAQAMAMADTLANRGPDGRSSWGDQDAGIGLGHRRLSIVDLTAAGDQPMHSANGRYVISYNGEVYNFLELRAELEVLGHRFRSTSDTEVMLAAIVEWGLEAAVGRFVGMFAFALFDRQNRTLSLVRDRLGVKPLYWTVADGVLLFGSSLRALMAHPSFRRDIDVNAVAALVRYSYVPAPSSIFRNVFKLPPASILTACRGSECRITNYWSVESFAHSQDANLDEKAASEQLETLLRDSIAKRMIADVPVGAFLSGGVDSSTVVALMQAQSTRQVRTFTIGFQDSAFNEAPYAKAIAQHLGTDHTEVMLAPDMALKLVHQIPDWFDEPFSDSSQLPTYLVSQVTRQHVTVALSGDGGDELFAGYPKYASLETIWRYAGALPRFVRSSVGRALHAMPERSLRFLLNSNDSRIGEKARRVAFALQTANIDDASLAIDTVGLAGRLVKNASNPARPPRLSEIMLSDPISRMQLNDSIGYLPDDILTKVDRCSMAVSLEAREPLLDHRVVEFIWSLPAAIRRNFAHPKGLLRSVLRRYVPDKLTQHPKHGFSVPLDSWLRGPLRPWAEDMLSEARLNSDGIFDTRCVRAVWKRHLLGTETNATGLWNILMMQSWMRRWMSP